MVKQQQKKMAMENIQFEKELNKIRRTLSYFTEIKDELKIEKQFLMNEKKAMDLYLNDFIRKLNVKENELNELLLKNEHRNNTLNNSFKELNEKILIFENEKKKF